MQTSPEVDDYLQKKAHPLTAEIQRVREIILSTDPVMEETIKWSTPTFIYKGNMASFSMHAKKFVSLMFHKGALLDDPYGLLDGDGKEVRIARFTDMDDIAGKQAALRAVVRAWIAHRDA
ncbi:MAG: DUF1801 domain-containing protein [Saprospiraceae bacterium]|nr:DUF1801 domain-containing protein [Saprospiraceae bacterium]